MVQSPKYSATNLLQCHSHILFVFRIVFHVLFRFFKHMCCFLFVISVYCSLRYYAFLACYDIFDCFVLLFISGPSVDQFVVYA